MRGQPENCRKENTLEGTWRYMYDQNVGPVNDIQQSPDVKQPCSQAFPPPTFDRLQCEKTEHTASNQKLEAGKAWVRSQCKACVYQHMYVFITSTVLSSLQRQKREQQDMVSEGSFVIVILYSRQNLFHLGVQYVIWGIHVCLYQLKTPHITVYCIRLFSLHSSGVFNTFWAKIAI